MRVSLLLRTLLCRRNIWVYWKQKTKKEKDHFRNSTKIDSLYLPLHNFPGFSFKQFKFFLLKLDFLASEKKSQWTENRNDKKRNERKLMILWYETVCKYMINEKKMEKIKREGELNTSTAILWNSNFYY